MKRVLRYLLSMTLVVVLAFSFTACNSKDAATQNGIWQNATYVNDTEVGEGSKTLNVEVKAEDKIVKFTVHTDESTVGAALLSNNLIAGDDSEYGLYIKVVDGITADYDVDQSYWAFYINDEYALSGADTTEITEGAVYKFEYTK